MLKPISLYRALGRDAAVEYNWLREDRSDAITASACAAIAAELCAEDREAASRAFDEAYQANRTN